MTFEAQGTKLICFRERIRCVDVFSVRIHVSGLLDFEI